MVSSRLIVKMTFINLLDVEICLMNVNSLKQLDIVHRDGIEITNLEGGKFETFF